MCVVDTRLVTGADYSHRQQIRNGFCKKIRQSREYCFEGSN